jgi:hypothetical protein
MNTDSHFIRIFPNGQCSVRCGCGCGTLAFGKVNFNTVCPTRCIPHSEEFREVHVNHPKKFQSSVVQSKDVQHRE